MHHLYRLFIVLILCSVLPTVATAGWFSKDPLKREIISTPAGAKVSYSLKGEDQWVALGTTPFADQFEPDKFPAGYYRVEKEGYKSETRLQPAPPANGKPQSFKLAFSMQPITTIRLTVTSKPSEAMILFGTDKNNITKQLGPTPYKESKTDAASEEKPSWEKGYYLARLNGYRPKMIATEASSSDVELHFDLEPLPTAPAPPEIEYPDADAVAYKPVFIDAFKNPDEEIPTAAAVAVMDFNGVPKDVQTTITDSLILKLQRKGFPVLEREYLEKAIADVNGPAPAPVAAGATEAVGSVAVPAPAAGLDARKRLSGIELIKNIADPLKTRYFLIGSITEYSSAKEDVTIAPTISAKEKTRYQKDYDAYVGYFKAENLALPQQPKTLQEWELDYGSKGRSAKMHVARVAVTAKLLDVKTSKTVWTGMLNISDSGLQRALNKVLDAIAESIAKGETTEGRKKQ
ncbi:hypothetical protein [Geomesophilobacter sediminis]|uniref:PEGA domain-containing protein n=1 Tax=Geomesophilobacter sediminis TaxID=2798584 RepID=A0A8J7M056_9BACT|nr:hypothetical protein [Geomesophilobacter sediminis]MBJ6723432.1 hypothetical protein [Geomesophilobacter sediminis]